MALTLITPPTVKPISLTEAKAHLRVDTSDEDTLIQLLIDAATGHVDGPGAFLGRALIDQTWQLTLDAFPENEIKIPLPPLIAVTSVIYDDPSSAAPITLDPAEYSVDTANEPGWIVPVDTWPATFDGINAVRIRYRAGYVDTGNSPATGAVPADIKGALLLLIGSLYANREQVVAGQAAVALPWGAEQLLRRKRVDISMA